MVEGFKHTEAGLIPSDWVVKKIGECLLKNPDYGINAAAVPFNENLPVYLRITDITEDGNYSKKNLVSVNNLSSASYFLQDGDLVFARTGASVGKTYLYNPKDGKLVFAGFLIRVRAKEEILLPNYLKYFTQTKQYWDWIAANSMRTGQPGINGNEYKEISIPLPQTKAEQTAIAIALNDVDALITGLEKLITKKKAIKQGAMQELLRPKEGWSEKKFKDFCWFQEGPGLRNWQFTKSGIKVINVTNLENGILNLDRTDRHISLYEFHKMYEHFEIDENDIVVASSGNSYGKVSVVRSQDLPLLMNTSVIRFKPLKNLDYNYLLTFLKSQHFKTQIDLLITGGAQPNFGPAHLNKIIINIPATIEEQHRIATILYNMDAEIERLERKFEKCKMVKQGMMQNLLTGKIRLV